MLLVNREECRIHQTVTRRFAAIAQFKWSTISLYSHVQLLIITCAHHLVFRTRSGFFDDKTPESLTHPMNGARYAFLNTPRVDLDRSSPKVKPTGFRERELCLLGDCYAASWSRFR